MIYETQPAIAAAALGACWVFEAVIPAAHPREGVGGIRVRHVLLGLLNAIPAIGIAAGLACLDGVSAFFGGGALPSLGLPTWGRVLLAFLILDLGQYTCHVLMHKAPILWRLHAVHHHAERFESTAAFRFHTLEIVAHGLSLAPLVIFLGVRVHDIAIYNAVLLPMSLFHHATVRMRGWLDRGLGWVVITPGLHRVHHSRWQPQTDSNYSAVLSVWDRVFGTLTRAERPEAIPVGLDGFEPEHTETLRGMLGTPFSSARAELGSPPEGERESGGRV
ncbi:MAG: sterol desaturase family protein [Phycisphaerales bacterium JB059]